MKTPASPRRAVRYLYVPGNNTTDLKIYDHVMLLFRTGHIHAFMQTTVPYERVDFQDWDHYLVYDDGTLEKMGPGN